MKSVLQALLFAPEHHDKIVDGTKKITIREGHRDYKAKHIVMLCCHIVGFCKMADVVSVAHCMLGEVSQKELEADGFKNQEDLLNGMRRYYPNINKTSPVTVITWDNVR